MGKKIIFLLLVVAVALGSYLVGTRTKGGDRVPGVKLTGPSEKIAEEEPSVLPGTVRVGPDKRQLVGIRVGQVERGPFTHTIRLLGKVAPDETRIYFINATVDGWITKTFPNTTGSLVKKNETLAAFYSPEFLSASQALLFALGSKDRVQTTGQESVAQKGQLAQFEINLQQYKDSLKNLGMGDLQIEEMIQKRRYMPNIDIVSPADGIILVRNVSLGLRFEKSRELYRLADLSRIWILADVYGNEVQYFKPGVEARVTLPDQGKVYRARVSQVPPVFDASTRTLKVRLETTNPGLTLRPDMFVDVELPVNLPPAISVPADAVLDTGVRKTVFIDRGNGYFEPREVATGWRLGDRVEITRGLKPGDRIVTSGTFLIDSESRMELAAAGIAGSLAKDPVSGLEVSIRKAEKAGLKRSFQGNNYYFCSRETQSQFDRDPDHFGKQQQISGESTSPSPNLKR